MDSTTPGIMCNPQLSLDDQLLLPQDQVSIQFQNACNISQTHFAEPLCFDARGPNWQRKKNSASSTTTQVSCRDVAAKTTVKIPEELLAPSCRLFPQALNGTTKGETQISQGEASHSLEESLES